MGAAEKILLLKQARDKAQQLRATAEGTLTLARKQLEEIDVKLQGLGIDPEHAPAQLKDLEDKLEVAVSELSIQIAAETKAYQEILDVAKQVFG